MLLATANRNHTRDETFAHSLATARRANQAETNEMSSNGDSATDSLLGRALTLIEALSEDGTAAGVSELARRCNLPKSTTHRLLGILEKSGVVRRVPAGYQLGHRLYGLLDSLHARPQQLRETLLPYLVDTYELGRESVQLGVRQDVSAVCVETLRGRRPDSAALRTGDRLPLHCTAMGKVLLAHAPESFRRRYLDGPLAAFTPATVTSPAAFSMELRRIRRDGFAIDRQEFLPGYVSVAVPVFGPDRSVVAALSITAPAGRFDPLQVVDGLRRIAAVATRDLIRQSL